MKAYRIVQWLSVHEFHTCRKLARLEWYARPNRHSGLAWRYLLKQDDRVELLCAWNLLLDVASWGWRRERGWLVRQGRPLSAMDLEVLTGFGVGLFERAFEFFSQPQMGWLAMEDFPGRDEDGTERDDTEQGPDTPGGHGTGKGRATRRKPPSSRGNPQPPVHKTVQDSTGQQKPSDNKGDGAAGKSAVLESRTQFASLARQEKELAAIPEEELTQPERERLGKIRAFLKDLTDRQARGEF